MEYFIYLFLFLRTKYFSFIYKIEFNKWNTLILYIRLNLKMFVYIGLFGNLQLKQQLKIILLQILPNTLKLHFQNARFKTNTFSKTHFYKQLIQTDTKLIQERGVYMMLNKYPRHISKIMYRLVN